MVIYFGLSSSDGSGVSEQEWQSFQRESVAAEFQQGFTVYAANGRWKNASGKLIAEQTRVVVKIFRSERREALRESVARIAAEFKKRFNMQSVLVSWSDVEVEFL